jgi:tRNA(Ile)-lysidine synthase TilS/MesJ
VPEGEVKGFAVKNNLPVVKNKCKADGNTKREEIKGFIKEQAKKYDNFEEIIFGAIKRSELEGWRDRYEGIPRRRGKANTDKA